MTMAGHIYQKTSINTIVLGNAHITKPSYLKQLTYFAILETFILLSFSLLLYVYIIYAYIVFYLVDF